MRFELVVFDWDGTLADSTSRIIKSMQAAFAGLGLPKPSAEQIRDIIGLNLHIAIQTLAGHLSPRRQRAIADGYRGTYAQIASSTHLFDGVSETLHALSATGYRLAIATGKGRTGLDRALTEQGLSDFFEATRCADECRSKPDPQMLHELMDATGVQPERTLMVGDTTHDLMMARNARVSAACVTYGAHDRQTLGACDPVFVLDRITDLPALLSSYDLNSGVVDSAIYR